MTVHEVEIVFKVLNVWIFKNIDLKTTLKMRYVRYLH